MSATMEEKSLQRISGTLVCIFVCYLPSKKTFPENLDIPLDEIKVLYKSSDRKNIFEQRRFASRPIDVRYVLIIHKPRTKFQFLSNVNSELAFLIPAFVDNKFVKCQIFCTTKIMTDIVGTL